jgi:hypothetical protein
MRDPPPGIPGGVLGQHPWRESLLRETGQGVFLLKWVGWLIYYKAKGAYLIKGGGWIYIAIYIGGVAQISKKNFF